MAGGDEEEEPSFSKKSLAYYTEKQYNDFGWVRVNNVLSKGQYFNFTTNFADAVKNKFTFPKTASGEWIIPVHELSGELEGVDNALVFAKGTIGSPKISKIIFIDDIGNELDHERRALYETERRGIQQTTEGVFRCYYPSDFGDYETAKRAIAYSERDYGGIGVQRGGSGSKTDGTAERTKRSVKRVKWKNP